MAGRGKGLTLFLKEELQLLEANKVNLHTFQLIRVKIPGLTIIATYRSPSHASHARARFKRHSPQTFAALEADALLGALLLKTTLAEAPAREVLHARLEKFESVLGAHRGVGECLEVGGAWIFH